MGLLIQTTFIKIAVILSHISLPYLLKKKDGVQRFLSLCCHTVDDYIKNVSFTEDPAICHDHASAILVHEAEKWFLYYLIF